MMKPEIIKSFVNLVKTELIKYSPYKFSEELFRYYFYKSLIENGYSDKQISYEANFIEKNKFDNQTDFSPSKVDLKFNDTFLEIKFHRELENGNARPFPYGLGKVLSDFFKLENAHIANIKKFVLYIFDDRYLKYIKNNNFEFLLNSEGIISLEEIKNNYNDTVNKQLKEYDHKTVKFKLIFNDQLKFMDDFEISKGNNHFNVYLYEIE